jgi:hypothetical protein
MQTCGRAEAAVENMVKMATGLFRFRTKSRCSFPKWNWRCAFSGHAHRSFSSLLAWQRRQKPHSIPPLIGGLIRRGQWIGLVRNGMDPVNAGWIQQSQEQQRTCRNRTRKHDQFAHIFRPLQIGSFDEEFLIAVPAGNFYPQRPATQPPCAPSHSRRSRFRAIFMPLTY